MTLNPNFKILYAEDESLTRLFISKLLSTIGTVTTAKNGAEALDLFQNEEFHIIVSDLSMPKMDGFELVQKIRTSNNAIPVIITSAYRNEYEELKTSVHFIEKPINSKMLLDLVTTESEKLNA